MNFINQLNNPETLEYLQREGLYGSEYTFNEPQQSVSNKQTQEKVTLQNKIMKKNKNRRHRSSYLLDVTGVGDAK